MAQYHLMFTLRLALLAIAVCACQTTGLAAAEPQALRYTITSNNRVAGSEIDTYFPDADIAPNGSIGMTFSQSIPFGSSDPRAGMMDMYVTGRTVLDPLGSPYDTDGQIKQPEAALERT